MRRLHAGGSRQVALREVAVPRPTEPGELLLRNHACGICGSDLHWFTGETDPPRFCPGHEIVATVAAVGPEVSGLREGDRVVAEGMRVCGACGFCTTGRPQLCPQLRLLGLHAHGGFSDFMIADARQLHRIDASLDDEVAGLAEPLAVCVHAVRIAELQRRERVLVLGAGTIGLLAVVACEAAGASEVVVAARRPHQQRAALALGAARAVPEVDLDEELGRNPDGFDLVLDTIADSGGTLATGIDAVRPGGTIVVLGVAQSQPPIDALRLMMREIRLIGSMCYGSAGGVADFEVALDILQHRGNLLRAEMITHRFELAEAATAFATAADKATGSIKVCIEIFDPDSGSAP